MNKPGPWVVTNLSGSLIRARPPLIGAAKLDDFFAAYLAAFGRQFPANLLPAAPLHVVGDRRGRRFARHEAAELNGADLPPRRTHPVQMLIGTKATRRYWLGKFSLGDFTRDCPPGFCLLGFDRRHLGILRFYYMRCDEWSRVLFRLPCRGLGLYDCRSVAAVPDFLAEFDAFIRRLRPRASSLVAFEKSGMVGSYEVTMADGASACSHQSQFHEPDFSALADRLLHV